MKNKSACVPRNIRPSKISVYRVFVEAYDVTDCVDIMTDDTEFVNSNCKLCVISLPEALSSRYGFINMCMQYIYPKI